MKRKSGSTKKKKRSLFNPTEIATSIRLALSRDMAGVTQMYDPTSHPIGRLAMDQSSLVLKKFADPAVDQSPLEQKAFTKFLEVNKHMSAIRAQFVEPQATCVLRSTPELEAILLKARAYMHMVLTDFDEDEWFSQCRNGPGTTIGVSYNDTSIEAKLEFPISMTCPVVPLMNRYLQYDFQLSAALKDFNAHQPLTGKYLVVEGSRATTVEKNDQIRRMIAVEPTGNMFFQQGLMALMYKRMRKFGLDVENLQPMHKARACRSSITSQEATIDWSSASDCNSRELLKWLMPPKWFSVCDLVRSPVMEIAGEKVELEMFSTMGNAVTFPLETLVFWTIGHAVLDLHRGYKSTLPDLRRKANGSWEKDWLEVSVFGDDCIVPSYIAERFIAALVSVGFIINSEKSFFRDSDRGFRESCGGDYLHGYDVRPFYLKAPSTLSKSSLEPWLNIMFNRLVRKYITCFGSLTYVYDKELWRVLEKVYADNGLKIKLVPGYFPDDAGVKISGDILRFLACYPRMKVSRVRRSKHGTYEFLYCRFIHRHSEYRFEPFHYIQALKKGAYGDEFSSVFRADKKKGGYVVAKGISSQWTVPSIKD